MSVVEKKTWVPKVPESRIQELARRIKPVVRFEKNTRTGIASGEGVLRHIKPVDLFSVAYTWDPKPGKKAAGLKKICDITTYHSWAYYGFFKPSIAEVLAQIPAEHVDKVVAFEIIASPQTASDLHGAAFDDGYHTATTRLYSK